MKKSITTISSPSNPRVKTVVKLRNRNHRDKLGLMIIEGYREIRQALHNKHYPTQLFFCEELFLGDNEQELIQRCEDANAELFSCTTSAFHKIAYRDRPDGLLALAPQIHNSLDSYKPGNNPLIVVAESIEKPGNLGTILRSADSAGADAVIVCDRCTDINNPNVVRASIGTLFTLPVIETSSEAAFKWLSQHGIQIVAATPHATQLYSDSDLTTGTAIVLGAEQYGLSDKWMDMANMKVRIPMLGQSDSLNVAAAATILLYEAVRQRDGRREAAQLSVNS